MAEVSIEDVVFDSIEGFWFSGENGCYEWSPVERVRYRSGHSPKSICSHLRESGRVESIQVINNKELEILQHAFANFGIRCFALAAGRWSFYLFGTTGGIFNRHRPEKEDEIAILISPSTYKYILGKIDGINSVYKPYLARKEALRPLPIPIREEILHHLMPFFHGELK